MAGCRSLSDSEVSLVLAVLKCPRDRCLFILGLRTGFRISELLSLTVGDVFQGGQVVERVRVTKRNMKGKTRSREVALHPQAKEAIQALLNAAGSVPGAQIPAASPGSPLFQSRVGHQKAISRHQAHKLLKEAYSAANLTGSLATHTMRKSFAKRVYSNLRYDLLATRDALGHSSITNTVQYLETNQQAIDQAVLAG